MRHTRNIKSVSLLLLSIILLLTLTITGCATPNANEKPTIRLVEMDWTSFMVETEIVKQVIEKQLGYPTQTIQMPATASWAALDRGDVDLAVEIWLPGRMPEIQPFLDKGTVVIGSEVFPALLGWRVPRYVIEGDPGRDIQPLAPNLKSILDLQTVEKGGKGYWKLFVGLENPGLGELVGGPPGWYDNSYDRMRIKGFDFPLWRSSQSEAVVLSRVLAADKRKEPILFSFSSPHGIFTSVNVVTLEEPVPWYEGAFEDESKGYASASPPNSVHTVAATKLKNKAPDVYQLIMNMVVGIEDVNNLMNSVDVENRLIGDVAAEWISHN